MINDFECVKNVQDLCDEDSLKLLIERHSGIYVDIINRFIREPYLNEIKLDLISDKDTFIYECAQTYNPTRKAKFSTYLGNQAKYRCLNLFNNPRNKNLHHKTVPINYATDLFHQPDIFKEVDLHERESIIFKVLETYPDDRAVTIFNLRYIEGDKNKVMSWKKIAKKLDLSSQGCIDIHNKLIKTIKKTYEQSNINWESNT